MQRDQHPRVAGAELPDDPRNRVEHGRAEHPDVETADLAATGELGPISCLCGERKDIPGLVEKHRAGIGQLDAARLADQQAHAQPFFELADLAAQRRLRHVQLKRGGTEAPLLDDRDEAAQVVQLHSSDIHEKTSSQRRSSLPDTKSCVLAAKPVEDLWLACAPSHREYKANISA
mgnify:CR=1 FL=1